jgi:hypothetical protein
MGGRDQSERLVAINRNQWSQSPGARTVFAAPACPSVVNDFTFDNFMNGGGTVEGTVTLPSSADGNYKASSVAVTSNSAGYGLGQYVAPPSRDAFIISGNKITDVHFYSFGLYNSSPAVTCCSLAFDNLGLAAALSNSPNSVAA